ncbi:COG0637 Predicted phosphatase/phosphohexomutase [Oxalobacteraceae bacterium]
MSKIKAVLFDMDGVLIDAKEWHYEALNRALDLFGMPISRFDHLSTFDGLPTRIKLEILSKERELPIELHDFINEMKQQFTMELVCTECRPRFAHEYALSNLKTLGYKIAVCSNSVRKTVDAMMESSGLFPYLDIIISNGDVKNSKPNPEMYIKAINHFGLSAEECLILEDNENGIRAAKASGAHLLVVRDVHEVNIQNILSAVNDIENKN